MIAVDLNQIPAMTAEDAGILVGCYASDFTKPGVYHVLIGSRSIVEEFNFLGDVETIEVPTKEELLANGDFDDEDRDYYAEMIEEFYGLSVEDDHINFGYTEEGYDVWLKVA